MDNITNEIVAWAIFLYLIAPVLYCTVGGAICRGGRGAALGALVGLPTMVVAIAVGMVLSEVALRPLNFFLSAQATSVAGAFVAGWSTRFIVDDQGKEKDKPT